MTSCAEPFPPFIYQNSFIIRKRLFFPFLSFSCCCNESFKRPLFYDVLHYDLNNKRLAVCVFTTARAENSRNRLKRKQKPFKESRSGGFSYLFIKMENICLNELSTRHTHTRKKESLFCGDDDEMGWEMTSILFSCGTTTPPLLRKVSITPTPTPTPGPFFPIIIGRDVPTRYHHHDCKKKCSAAAPSGGNSCWRDSHRHSGSVGRYNKAAATVE